MSRSYFLLNNEIRFYFDQNPKTLHFHEQVVKLTPKEAQTLKFAVDNCNNAIKADEIAVCLWGEEAVNNDYQNKKSQAITHVSKIRKRFEQLGYRKDWLQTEENQGYRLLCSVALVAPAKQDEQKVEVLKQQRRERMAVVKYSSISALASFLLFVFGFWLSRESSVVVNQLTPFPPLQGVSSEPRFSPDGRAIVFSHESGPGLSQIKLKLNNDINYRQLTQDHFDQGPVFSPSGQAVAFHRLSEEHCHIMLIELNQALEKTAEARNIADCSTATDYSSIAWLSEQRLLFTHREVDGEPMKVHQLDISAGEQSEYLGIQDKDYYGAGFYHIKYDSNTETLFALDGEDWSATNIHLKRKGEPLVLVKSIKDSLRSIAIYHGNIVFKDTDNQLKMFAIDDPEDVRLIYPNPLFPIDFPAIDSAYERLALVSGEYYQSEIHRYDLKTGSNRAFLSSQSRLKVPLAQNGELLAVSRESGINQIYVYREDIRFQLSNFKINHRITALASSNDRQWLAVNFHNGTTLFRRNERGLTQVKHFPLMLFPSFSHSNQRLLLSDHSQLPEQRFRLVEFDLAGFDGSGKIEPSGVVVNDAKFGIYRDREIIYTPSNSQGVYLFSVGGRKKINGDVYPINLSAFALDNGHLVMAVRPFKLIRMSLDSGKVEELPDSLFSSMSIDGDAIYYVSKKLGRMNILVGDIRQK